MYVIYNIYTTYYDGIASVAIICLRLSPRLVTNTDVTSIDQAEPGIFKFSEFKHRNIELKEFYRVYMFYLILALEGASCNEKA